MRIAVLGLGRMGWHMAAHLAGEGASHDLVVFDVVEGLGGGGRTSMVARWRTPLHLQSQAPIS